MMTKVNPNNKSFQNKEHFERSSWLYANNSLSSVGNNYVTMKKKTKKKQKTSISK